MSLEFLRCGNYRKLNRNLTLKRGWLECLIYVLCIYIYTVYIHTYCIYSIYIYIYIYIYTVRILDRNKVNKWLILMVKLMVKAHQKVLTNQPRAYIRRITVCTIRHQERCFMNLKAHNHEYPTMRKTIQFWKNLWGISSWSNMAA